MLIGHKLIGHYSTGVAFFGTPHNGGNKTLVTLGGVAAKIALGSGFQKGDNIIQTLESGSLFTDTLQEHWRHQLLKYDIVSFWGNQDNVGLCNPSNFGLRSTYPDASFVRSCQKRAHDSAYPATRSTLSS
jgi:hypothetical protein